MVEQNINRVLQNAEDLEAVETKSEILRQDAAQFQIAEASSSSTEVSTCECLSIDPRITPKEDTPRQCSKEAQAAINEYSTAIWFNIFGRIY